MTAERERTVVVVLHEPVHGGATKAVTRTISLLEERGWRFAFWAPRPSALFDELSESGYRVAGEPHYIEYSLRAWFLPPGPRRRLRALPGYVRAFRAFLEAQRPTLVHANSILTLSEALLAKRWGWPVLLHVHEMLPSSLRGRLLRRLAWRQLDEVVAVSRASADRLALGRAPRIVFEGAPVPAESVELRRNPDPFTVGTVAVISTRKGSDLFVEAARQLLERGARFRFEMVGAANEALEREWAAEVLERARALGIEHRPSADVFERFRHWDAFVLPSRADPFPISMLEAMASGLPVIGARTDGIAEQIADGCGLLVEPDDPTALAEAIARIAAQPHDARAAMGAAARRRVAERFAVEHQARRLHEAYAAAVGGPV